MRCYHLMLAVATVFDVDVNVDGSWLIINSV